MRIYTTSNLEARQYKLCRRFVLPATALTRLGADSLLKLAQARSAAISWSLFILERPGMFFAWAREYSAALLS